MKLICPPTEWKSKINVDIVEQTNGCVCMNRLRFINLTEIQSRAPQHDNTHHEAKQTSDGQFTIKHTITSISKAPPADKLCCLFFQQGPWDTRSHQSHSIWLQWNNFIATVYHLTGRNNWPSCRTGIPTRAASKQKGGDGVRLHSAHSIAEPSKHHRLVSGNSS